MGTKGRPKNPTGWEFSIYAKLKQITKGRKITYYKAWLQLTEHRNFAHLMKPHFQKLKKYKRQINLERFNNRSRLEENFL